MGLIYCFTEKSTGLKYVGLTMKPFLERKYGHLKEAFAGTSASPFKVAIRSYGVENFDDNFTSEILEDGLNDIEIYQREMYWIEKLNTFWYDRDEFGNPCGYNATRGGEGAAWGLGKPVVGINVETFEVLYFNLAREAAEVVKCSVGNITGACNGCGGNHQAKGFVWLYEDEYNDILESGGTAQEYVYLKLNFIVQILEDNSIVAYHRTFEDAAKAVNGSASLICKYCNAECQKNLYKGFRWQYYRDFKRNGARDLRDGKLREVVKVSSEGIVVEEFENVNRAANAADLENKHVWCSCNGERVSALSNGYHYRYKDDFEENGLVIREEISRALDKVLQFKDGEVIAEFESAKSAAEYNSVDPSSVRRCCKGVRRSSINGNSWFMYSKDYAKRGYVGPTSSTKSVVKTDLMGNFLELYETRSEASDNNGIGGNRVSESCSGERKSPFFDPKGKACWFFNESDFYRPIFYTSDGIQTAHATLGSAALQLGIPIREVFLKCLGKVSDRHFYFLDSLGLSEEQYEEIVSNFEEDFFDETEDFSDETTSSTQEEIKEYKTQTEEVAQEVKEIKQMGQFQK